MHNLIMSTDALTLQQEKFAQGCVELTNQSAAYRQAYNVQPGTKFTSVAEAACKIAALPHVAARIAELRTVAAERSAIPAAATRIAEMRAIEATFVDEIIRVNFHNCRHCYGEGFAFQWRDEQEYAEACQRALAPDGSGKIPPCDGGYGYHARREPNPDCNRCWGVGVQTHELTDWRTWSVGARRLYRGIKIKGDGSMEVLLADKDKITDMLNRVQAIYKDGLAALPVQEAKSEATAAAAAKTPEERRQTYLRVVSGK